MPKGSKDEAAGAGVSDVARALKLLRIKAGISLAKMAKAIGMSTTGYQHYEDRYKKPRFERDFLEKILAVLRERGVPEEDLAALGDAGEAVAGTLAELVEEIRLLRQEISAIRADRRKRGNAN